MNDTALKIETVVLDFGRRFSEQKPNPPISCAKRIGEMVVSAAIGSGVRYNVAERIAKRVVESPSEEVIQAESLKHRFPNQTRDRLSTLFARNADILSKAIECTRNPKCVHAARATLADIVPGMGPKQSSFVLSICGYGQDIAVLDRHIIRFLDLVGIVADSKAPTNWPRYHEMERSFLCYSREKNIHADALDLAIWLTMKAVGRKVL